MKNKLYSIAIDGPAGSGKSTISKLLAEKLSIGYLNTGALYRTITYCCKNKEIDIYNEQDVVAISDNADIKVEFEGTKQLNYLDGELVNEHLFNKTIDEMVSQVSNYKKVREKLVELQRKIAKSNSIVVEGRDIGSVVLPNAEYKFYLSANPEIRAMRRYKEYLSKGIEVDYNKVYKDMIERDYQNSHREISPLVVAKGAIVVDTSNLGIDEVVSLIIKLIKGK